MFLLLKTNFSETKDLYNILEVTNTPIKISRNNIYSMDGILDGFELIEYGYCVFNKCDKHEILLCAVTQEELKSKIINMYPEHFL